MKLSALPLLVLLAAPLVGQDLSFKSEVDNLIRSLRETANPDGSLGDGSTLTTARILAAMGNCHRFFAIHDGPIVQPHVNVLFKRRTGVGAFDEPGGKGSVEVTKAVIDALEAMGPAEYAQEIHECRAWLRDQKSEGRGPLGVRLEEFRKLAASADGKKALEESARQAAAGMRKGLPKRADGTPDLPAAVQALEQFVAMQMLARELKARGATQQKADTPVVVNFAASQQKAFDFLMKGQKEGKFFAGPPGKEVASLELTALALGGLQTKPKATRTPAEQAAIDQGLAWIAASQTEAGSFGTDNVNYVTCAGIYALARAEDAKWKDALGKAQRFVLSLQNTERRGYAQGDRDYGSIGYGGSGRGDLSNLNFAIEALRASGLPAQDEALQKAIVFLQRTQNLRQVNDHKGRGRDDDTGTWYDVTSGDDGGSAYYPGNSPMGYVTLEDGTKVPRSYGSMTYALLKAYMLCGLKSDDPRVVAAVGWIQKHWTLSENPGADVQRYGDAARHQGLFYYYMMLAQALDLVGIDAFKVGDAQVEWRKDLRKTLEASQKPDGSWVNEKNARWWENVPTLCTVYALIALEKCR